MVIIAHTLEEAIFIFRENRFVGIIEINGKREKVHIQNPGRMIHFIIPGAIILVENWASPKRKLPYSLIYVIHSDSLILIESQFSNKIVKEALQLRRIEPFQSVKKILAEQKYGRTQKSRIDFLLDDFIYLEVKSTNYMENGIGFFPDAPSLRAQKHIQELIELIENVPNAEAWVLFLCQRTDITEIRPFDCIDPKFSAALRSAVKKGVHVIGFTIEYLNSGLEIELGREIPVNLT